MSAPRCLQAPQGAAAAQAAGIRGALPRLETERLVLRAPEAGDVSLWSRLLQGYDPEITDEGAWLEFCTYAAGWLIHGHGLWTVETRGGEAIGFVLLGLEWEDHEPELGYFIAPQHQCKGYAAEACKAVVAHAEALLGTGAFVSYIARDNDHSASLAKRIGAARDPKAEAALNDAVMVWRYGEVTA